MNVWFVVPAAGTGRRFGSPVPKQYLDLAGRKIIEHTLERLLALEPAGIAVAIGTGDTWWETLPLSRHPLIHRIACGETEFRGRGPGLAGTEVRTTARRRPALRDLG